MVYVKTIKIWPLHFTFVFFFKTKSSNNFTCIWARLLVHGQLLSTYGFLDDLFCVFHCDLKTLTLMEGSHIGAIYNSQWGSWGNMLGLWITPSSSISCTYFQVWLVWGHNKSKHVEMWKQGLLVEALAGPVLCLCPPCVYALCDM